MFFEIFETTFCFPANYLFQLEYCCPGEFERNFEEAFKLLVKTRYKAIVSDMKRDWFQEKKKPAVIHDDVWKKWLDWWNDPEAKKQAKRNRENRNKVQVVATGGPVSLADHTNRMKRKHGNHIDEGDTFAALHTRRGKNGEFLWACDASGKVYDSYKVKAKEKSIIEGSIDPEVDPNAKVAFDRYAWNEAATEFKKAEGKQALKGYRLVGFGEGGKKVLNIPTARPGFYYPDSPRIAPYLDQTVMEERLRESNEKTQRLEEQVGKLSEMCKILLKEKEERERQQTMMSQRGPSWCSPMGYFPPSGMFPPGGLYSQHQSQYNYQFQQMQQQNSRQSSASPNSGGRGSGSGNGNGNGGGSGGGNGGYGLYMDMLRDGGVNFNFDSGLGGGNSGGWARGSGNGGGNNV